MTDDARSFKSLFVHHWYVSSISLIFEQVISLVSTHQIRIAAYKCPITNSTECSKEIMDIMSWKYSHHKNDGSSLVKFSQRQKRESSSQFSLSLKKWSRLGDLNQTIRTRTQEIPTNRSELNKISQNIEAPVVFGYNKIRPKCDVQAL